MEWNSLEQYSTDELKTFGRRLTLAAAHKREVTSPSSSSLPMRSPPALPNPQQHPLGHRHRRHYCADRQAVQFSPERSPPWLDRRQRTRGGPPALPWPLAPAWGAVHHHERQTEAQRLRSPPAPPTSSAWASPTRPTRPAWATAAEARAVLPERSPPAAPLGVLAPRVAG
ncbi:hypothetical protein [Phormidium tenue]|uniref:Uncharacterized protein n=1 Tax=Phormidium tenue NIES-30 TaxID=549789 RepID=A0A1U7J1V6_9CYAN|nr:hypothetical protein [Phormidium tenue]MBD2233648.1 hypothetical protein [Phormidium tenue FACHB-1052]OKH46071.1 hypothetical protein NIES30_17360 [Phormidium tenue NIES-30]